MAPTQVLVIAKKQMIRLLNATGDCGSIHRARPRAPHRLEADLAAQFLRSSSASFEP
jgi:hypothetical protein